MSQSQQSRAKSIAAFMFLPQFGTSLQGMSHILPIFIRTIALIFASVGLIARNHPATQYGSQRASKYKFRDLMGDGWTTLRTTRATASQWSLYIAIVMMLTFAVCSVGSAILSVAFSATSTAQAQIFTHPDNPYGGTDHATGLDKAEALGVGANAVFDTRFSSTSTYNTGNPASVDYALMVLDKVLRQGAEDTGGSTQRALQPLMEVYNTGVLVVAAVMLFWLILSIVVDTAKTGQIGGGRHNMVWAPIRIVFALGLMIPLGASGFSSGQYMVMKLAEWGSNFGSTAWSHYISAVTTTDSIIPGYKPQNVSKVAQALAKIKVCQVVNNAYANTNTVVDEDELIAMAVNAGDSKKKQIDYTNSSSGVKCGSVWWSVPGFWDGVGDSAQAGLLAVVGGMVSQPRYVLNFKQQMQATVSGLLDETQNTSLSLSVYGPATQFACSFGAQFYASETGGGGAAANAVLKQGPGQVCTESAWDDTYGYRIFVTPANIDGSSPLCTGGNSTPGTSCHEAMTSAIVNSMNLAFCGQLDCTQPQDAAALNTPALSAINDLRAEYAGALVEDNNARGWAGMGMWYNTITLIVNLSNEMETLEAGVLPGTMWQSGEGSSIDAKVFQALDVYDGWWQAATTLRRAADGTPEAGQTTIYMDVNENSTTLSGRSPNSNKQLRKSDKDGSGFFGGDRDDEWFIYDILQGANDNIYPIAGLANTGDDIMASGIALLVVQAAGNTGIKVANGVIKAMTFGLVDDAIDPSILDFVRMIGYILIVCGIMLTYYLPILPFIRVAFAVLTWIISVFEAVCMIPIAALAHLTTEGDGIAGGAKQVWILWLNILMRPVLVVLGYVGAMLVFNTFITYFQPAFATIAITASTASSWFDTIVMKFVFTLVYVATIYTAANIVFKMLETVPAGLMRWMGGQPDHSFDDHSHTMEGLLMAGTNLISRMPPRKPPEGKQDKEGPGATPT